MKLVLKHSAPTSIHRNRKISYVDRIIIKNIEKKYKLIRLILSYSGALK